VEAHFAGDNLDEVVAATLRMLPEAIVLCDETHVLFANEAARRLLGGSRAAEVEGASYLRFLDHEYADTNAEQQAYVLHNLVEFVDFPVKVHTLDDEILRLRVGMRPVSLDGTTVAMVKLAP